MTLGPNKNLSFCPRAIIVGEPQPYVVGSGSSHTHMCHNLLLSIANPRVFHGALHSGSDSHEEFGPHTFPKSVLQQLAAALGIQLPSSFTLPLHPTSGAAAPDTIPARTAIPKNLAIMFGAHRASVYGSSAAAKTYPLTVSVKYLVREAHARDFIHKPIQPKILDEEFPDYQKLLEDMAIDPTPVTMAGVPSLAAAPFALGQKRFRGIPTAREGEIEDTGASSSGSHHAANASGAPDPTLPPSHKPTG